MAAGVVIIVTAEVIDRDRSTDERACGRNGQRLQRKDVVDQVVVIEVEGGPALNRRQILHTDAAKWPRAEAAIVEVDANAAAEEHPVAGAIIGAAADGIGVNVLIGLREFMTADREIERHLRRGPLLRGEVDAAQREVIGIVRIRIRPAQIRRWTEMA